MRGLSTEVPVGSANGLEQDSVVSCDNIVTIPVSALGRGLGFFFPSQEAACPRRSGPRSTWNEGPRGGTAGAPQVPGHRREVWW